MSRARANSLRRRAQRKTLARRYGPWCAKCGRFGGTLTLDHIVPISRGGKNNLANLQLLCHPCNQEKADLVEAPVWVTA